MEITINSYPPLPVRLPFFTRMTFFQSHVPGGCSEQNLVQLIQLMSWHSKSWIETCNIYGSYTGLITRGSPTSTSMNIPQVVDVFSLKTACFGGVDFEKTHLVGALEHAFVFPYIGNNHPNWLIFFRGVETTNQPKISKRTILHEKISSTNPVLGGQSPCWILLVYWQHHAICSSLSGQKIPNLPVGLPVLNEYPLAI